MRLNICIILAVSLVKRYLSALCVSVVNSYRSGLCTSTRVTAKRKPRPITTIAATCSAAATKRAPGSCARTSRTPRSTDAAPTACCTWTRWTRSGSTATSSARGRARRQLLRASSFMGALAAVGPWFQRLAHAATDGAVATAPAGGQGGSMIVESNKETVQLGVFDANLPPIADDRIPATSSAFRTRGRIF